jgi:hypothetical protein
MQTQRPTYTEEQLRSLVLSYFPSLEICPKQSKFEQDHQYFYIATKPTKSGWEFYLEFTRFDEPVLAGLFIRDRMGFHARHSHDAGECLKSLRQQFESLMKEVI